MQVFETKFRKKMTILALGAESAGNFSVFSEGKIYFSSDFGDLLEETNFHKYKHELNKFLRQNKIRPKIILTDLHPLYRTTILGQKLSKKFKAEHIQIQHHVAHIFSAIGEKVILDTKYKLPNTTIGIALDGTGYGLDGKIWGSEMFKACRDRIPTIKGSDPYGLNITRIGHLENQTLIGGDLAIQEPARMLVSILSKLLDKKEVYVRVKKHYSKNEFEVLYNQLQTNFNCIETSSTGRILDAVSILLGFTSNKRNYKHEPIDLLEKKSTKPYANLKPKIIFDKKEKLYILQTTPLFEYLIKNVKKDKKRLAATAQLYIAQSLYEIIKLQIKNKKIQIFLVGGIANNKIISQYLESKGAYTNEKVPRGDAGLSLGQIIYHLLF
jgi:hydrogenase maturation protein HypF